MPFNGSGTFSVVNTFVPNTTISSSAMNANFTDIAQNGLSAVLTRDGQSSMTGQFKAANGTVSAPGITFSTDLNTGIYRISGDNIGIAAGATKIVDISTTGVEIVGTLTASDLLTASAGLTVVGTVTLPNDAIVTAAIDDDAVTTAKIADENVTFAKIQDVSTGTLVGRSTASTGSVEQITVSTGLTLSGGNLSVTTPAALTLLASQTASSSSSLVFTSGFSSSYDAYLFEIISLRPITNDAELYFRISTDGGSNYRTTSYFSTAFFTDTGGGSSTPITTLSVQLSQSSGGSAGISNSSNYGWSGSVVISNIASSSLRKTVRFNGGYVKSNGTEFASGSGGGTWNGGNDAINAIQFIMSGSGITSGTIRMYGLRNS